MAGPYSQDLRDRVIDAVVQGGMSRRGALGSANRLRSNGSSVSSERVCGPLERWAATSVRGSSLIESSLKPVAPRSPTSPFRRCATGCWKSAASRPTRR